MNFFKLSSVTSKGNRRSFGTKVLFALIPLLVDSSAFAEMWNDVSRLNQENIREVVTVESEHDVTGLLRNTHPGDHVTISGTRHSQGGHIVYPDATVLDMSNFNKIISVSKSDKSIIVQSGATWADVQQAINTHGLSIKVMQSSNVFSIGGSLSANIHGRDPMHGPLIESIKNIRIVLSSGEVVTANRDENSDLFYAAIGGYGLLGVILEAEIELTENVMLSKTTTNTDFAEYTTELHESLDNLALHYGRCSFVKDQTFLRECYSTNFHIVDSAPVERPLLEEANIERNSAIFNLSRKSNAGKSLRWNLQKMLVDVPGKKTLIDRNNAMRPPVEFLKYVSSTDTDILQEYFVPITNFSQFFEELRDVLLENDVNLLSITLRSLKKNEESILSYATEDMIAIVLYVNIEISKRSVSMAEEWTRKLVSSVIRHNGTYYLTYQRFPTMKQFRRAYPNWQQFLETKCKYDPKLIFTNKFFDRYLNVDYTKTNRSGPQSKAKITCH